jgi:hypothetical protein
MVAPDPHAAVDGGGSAPDRDAGIEHRVEEVDEGVGDHERRRQHERDPLDHGGAWPSGTDRSSGGAGCR